MTAVSVVLNICSGLAALGAAWFWLRSALHELPQPVTYWNGSPPSDPFFMALQAGVRLNRWAAAFAGIAALLQAVASVLPLVMQA
jgi:hypothetical protein